MLGHMRGLAAKAGQMASYVDGMVPEEFRPAFEKGMAKLRAAAPSSSPEQIRAVVEEDLEAPVDRLFAAHRPGSVPAGDHAGEDRSANEHRTSARAPNGRRSRGSIDPEPPWRGLRGRSGAPRNGRAIEPLESGPPEANFDASPAGYDASPAGCDASPADDDASPAGCEASPADDDASPAGYDASPADDDASPARYDASPADDDASPAGCEASPANDDAPYPAVRAFPAAVRAFPETVRASPAAVRTPTMARSWSGRTPGDGQPPGRPVGADFMCGTGKVSGASRPPMWAPPGSGA